MTERSPMDLCGTCACVAYEARGTRQLADMVCRSRDSDQTGRTVQAYGWCQWYRQPMDPYEEVTG